MSLTLVSSGGRCQRLGDLRHSPTPAVPLGWRRAFVRDGRSGRLAVQVSDVRVLAGDTNGLERRTDCNMLRRRRCCLDDEVRYNNSYQGKDFCAWSHPRTPKGWANPSLPSAIFHRTDSQAQISM